MEAAPHPWPALGVLLLRDGFVTTEDLEAILAEQRDSKRQRLTGWRLGEILVERGVVTQDQVASLVAEQYELPFVELDEDAVDPRVASRLPDDLVERFSALPIEIQSDGTLLLAVADPAAVLFSDELRRAVGMPLRFAVAAPPALRAAIVSARARAGEAPHSSFDTPSFALVRASAESYVTRAADGLGPNDPEAPPTWPPLGTLLVRDGLVTEDELETALAQQRLSSNKRLGEILVERGSVTRTDIARIVAEQYELPFIDLVPDELDERIDALMPEDVARRYSAVPVRFEPDGSLLVAVADPTKVLDPEEILEVLGARFSFAVADPDAIESAILRRRLGPTDGHTDVDVEEVATTPTAPEPLAVATAETADPWLDGTSEGEEAEPPAAAEGSHESILLALAPPASTHEPATTTADVERGTDEDAASDADRSEVVALVPVVAEEPADTPEPTSLLLPDHTPSATHTPVEYAETGDADPEAKTDTRTTAPATDDADPEEEAATPFEPELSEPRTHGIAPAEEEPAEDELRPTTASVEDLLERARALEASSVHFSPQEGHLVVRARVEGAMQVLAVLADGARSAAEEALRTLAEASEADLQVAVLPTRHGDSVAIQLPENRDWAPSLADLALPEDDEAALREALAHTSGLVLVVGPPGSGRTTTLYASLGELEPRERALVTVESPVHRALPEIDQVAVDERFDGDVGRAFASALAVDPDVVLVDEITNSELARLVVEAAPGRLVLTTLEAPSASAAVRRLADLDVGVDASMRALTAVVAQRLVRRLCTSCRESYFATAADLAELGRPEDEAGVRLLARGKGCRSCVGTGFRGRIAVISVVVPADELELLASRGDADDVLDALERLGSERLLSSAVRLCLDGVTTPAEALKAASPPP